MIHLNTYITNKLNNEILIENELELHFYAEFILNESLKHSYFNILEKNGSYIGQKELIIDLSKSIYNAVRNNEPYDKIKLDEKDIVGYSNIFFKTVTIYITNKTGYIASKSKYIKNEKKFDNITICIDTDEYNSYTGITKCLMHEFLHAYNDYKSYLTGSKFTLSDLTDKNSSYYKTIFSGSQTPSDICKRILNNIRQWEQNAYISELSVELENNKFDINKYNTVNDAYKAAYKIFKKSDTWIQYSTLWNYLIYINSKPRNSKERLDFQTTYNNINNSALTFNQIYKKLDGLFYKILKKIESKIPKIFYDYYQQELSSLNESFISGRQNNALIEFIHYIRDYDLSESVKPDSGLDWEVYIDEHFDEYFTEVAKNWKQYPKVGNGWYKDGTIFKIIKIDDNKVYVIT